MLFLGCEVWLCNLNWKQSSPHTHTQAHTFSFAFVHPPTWKPPNCSGLIPPNFSRAQGPPPTMCLWVYCE